MPDDKDNEPLTEKFIREYLRSKESQAVLPSLMLSAIYKLSTNPKYDLEDESQIYKAYLANYNIYPKYGFKDMFMDVMTGKDPTLIYLGLVGTEQRVLNEDGTFVDEGIRERIASEGRFSAHLGPRLVR